MGDPNIHKLLQKNLGKHVREAEIDKLCQERLRRLKPLLKKIDFKTLIKEVPNLRFLDLGCNDGTILLALKRKYKDIEVFGLEHEYEKYKSTVEFLQSYANFTMKGGSWHDDNVYPRNYFDVVASIHAWPCPQNYPDRLDEISKIKAMGKDHAEVLFDKEYSVNELKRFMEFVKPGGYLLLKTWTTPLKRKKFHFRIKRKFPYKIIVKRNLGESFNISKRDLRQIGSVIYLNGNYLILQKKRTLRSPKVG